MIKFNAQLVTLDAAAEDGTPTRTITGLAVPWNVVANLSNDVGPVKFLEGSISVDGPMPKLLEYHDDTRVIGRVTERVSTEDGLMFVAKLSATRAADDALALLADGSISAVSVGAMPLKFKRVDGVMEVSEARLMEISLVSFPAYADAEISSVFASANDEEEIPEEETPPQPSEEDVPMSEPTTVEAAVATQPIYATAKQEFKMPSAGEWMAAQFAGGSIAAEFNARLRAAAPSVTTGDLDGIMPTPIVAPIYSGIQGLRPVVDAIGARAMPAGGKVFIVPKITTHTSIGGPQTQNATITAGQFIVDDVQVTKGIYGGYVQLSEASIDWSDPEVLGALLEDLGKKYALFTDDVAADALLTGTTQATGNVAPTDPADWVAKIYACANTILSSGNYLPDHLFVSGDVFAQLGSLNDTADRPLFPQVGPMNAFGTMNPGSRESIVFGLRLVVDTNFAAKTTIVGAAATGAFRCYEQQKGAIVADIGSGASTLSRDVAFRGYFAPIMIDANQFMKIPQA
jgi:HK97 family phage prohead protease